MKNVLLKKHLPVCLSLVMATQTKAQIITEKCATMPSLEYRMQHDPNVQQRFESYKNPSLRSTAHYDTTGYMVIPVVFHVVYNPGSPAQNIPDSLIHSQIGVLNRDYSYTHANISATLPIFDSLTGDAGFRFELASIDPMGNPTNGITRTSSTASHVLTPLFNSVKKDADGGKDPWPTNHYLNIWVCDMSFMGTPFVLGYATFPGDDPALDGVVLQYNYVGEQPGASTAPNNLGRTATHESGHWFGMRHIWGDGDCTMDDFVQDTPDSDAASSQDCQLTRNVCTDAGNLFWNGTNPPDMVQNFMDYSADGCMTLFTRMQIGRMWHKTITHRYDMFNSNGCGTPKINGYVITRNITCPSSCDGEASVTVVNGTAPFQYLWDTPTADTTAMVTGLCKGVYTVRVIDADNDTMYIHSYVKNHTNITATVNLSGASCDTCANGSVTINAMGGNPDYAYTLDGGSPQASNIFNDLTPGVHTILVSDSCGSTVTLAINIEALTGVSENITNAVGISVYPNPAHDEVSIRFEKPVRASINLTDATGRIVKQVELNDNQFITIHLNDLAGGLYQVMVLPENGHVNFVKRLIINR